VLFVPAQPPRRGEKLHFEEKTTFDFEVAGKATKGVVQFATDEVVQSVDHDVIDELQVTFADGKYQPNDAKPAIEVKGTYRVRGDSLGKPTFTSATDEAITEDAETVLVAYSRNDVGVQHWLLDLLTNRTYQVGQEADFGTQSVLAEAGKTKTARITLESVDGNLATFAIAGRFRDDKLALVYRGKAVLDTQRARLVSIDTVHQFDVPPEAKVKSSIVDHETFRYDHAVASEAVVSSTCEARTVYIPQIAPKAGDRYDVEQRIHVDETTTNTKTQKTQRLRGSWATSTQTRVLQEDTDKGGELEILVRKESIEPFTLSDQPAPAEMHENETLRIVSDVSGIRMTRNGAAVPAGDFAFAVAVVGDATKEWTTRLATRRTYEIGKEQTFGHEQISVLSPNSAQARVLLASVDHDIATFKLDFKTVLNLGKAFPIFMRGQMTFDMKKARPLDVHLDAAFDAPDGVTTTGDFTLDYKFSY
jgi:hypothetical protein